VGKIALAHYGLTIGSEGRKTRSFPQVQEENIRAAIKIMDWCLSKKKHMFSNPAKQQENHQ